MQPKCQSSQTPLILLVIVLSVLLSTRRQVLCARCPPKHWIKPCYCVDDEIIVCDGDINYDYRYVFENLNRIIGNDQDKHFDELVMNNTAITSLEDNFTSNITFRRIVIKDALSLSKISANAFGKNTATVEEFSIIGDSLIGDDKYVNELFDALSSLSKAKKIWLNRNKLKSIPFVAFGKIPGVNQDLIDLNFNRFSTNNGFIQSVGDYAFYYLNNLRHLYLSHQKIDHISTNAFDFEQRSNQTLYIYLGNNRLNNTSFERGVFLNSKRPIHLELYWNHQLNYLDEKIWAPFLKMDKRNTIRLGDNPLACDCKSYWMVRDKLKFKDQISNVKCKVGPNKVFNIDLIPFDQCKHKKAGRLRIIN